MYAIAIHGGAGAVPRATLPAERERRYRQGLEAALDSGYAVLEAGGTSLDSTPDTARRSPAMAPWSSTPPSWTAGRCAPGRSPQCGT